MAGELTFTGTGSLAVTGAASAICAGDPDPDDGDPKGDLSLGGGSFAITGCQDGLVSGSGVIELDTASLTAGTDYRVFGAYEVRQADGSLNFAGIRIIVTDDVGKTLPQDACKLYYAPTVLVETPDGWRVQQANPPF